VKALEAKGILAAALPADASDPASLRAAIAKGRAALGPVAVVHWNAYGGGEIGDLLGVDPTSIQKVFDVGVVGLVTAVQETLADLKANEGAVLITNGAFGDLAPQMDELAVQLKAMGLGLANAAKHKLVGLLAARLKAEGVYVGEVMVAGTVKGDGVGSGGGDAGGAGDRGQVLGDVQGAERGAGESELTAGVGENAGVSEEARG
jgi:NAD(P)-dependent dehydrogenase (short-subunit alcohol dehydrogenase family)